MLLLHSILRLAMLGVAAGKVHDERLWNQPAVGVDEHECPSSRELPLKALLDVFDTMQEAYFAPWLGTWETAIDWTAAVMETHASGALSTISRALDLVPRTCRWAGKGKENTVTLYFSEVLSFYFSQDHFAIRNEAYDDILWVVLGWLETIQFINLHTSKTSDEVSGSMGEHMTSYGRGSWHGKIWVPAFAHRARIFWNLAKQGWDRDLCGGGMVWNPRLEPYKNAITNQLFISASSAMYLHFPGDWNHSPFYNDADVTDPKHFSRPSANDVFSPSDPVFRTFAIDGYRWLEQSGMMNNRGLYIDGFHISGWKDEGSNKACDVRNEQVYTYNQGVILTGQLNLWRITGNYSYMEDGYALIHSVIAATGWDLGRQRPKENTIPSWDDISDGWRWSKTKLPHWHGLGRAGVIEEACDSQGTCSQDAQTFKGIFFHHLTTFCGTQPSSRRDFVESTNLTDQHIALHGERCASYRPWLYHNTLAMIRTRKRDGKIGTWWTAGLLGLTEMPAHEDFSGMDEPGAVDYRNGGVPDDNMWRRTPTGVTPPLMPLPQPEAQTAMAQKLAVEALVPLQPEILSLQQDLNDRGRGRTVETQGSGLALLRAFLEIDDGPTEAKTKAQETRERQRWKAEAEPDEL